MRFFAIPLLLLPLLAGGLASAQDSLRFELEGKTARGTEFTSTLTLARRSDGQYRAVRDWTLKGVGEGPQLIGVAQLGPASPTAPRTLEVTFRLAPGLTGSLGTPQAEHLRASYQLQGGSISGSLDTYGPQGTRQRVQERGQERAASRASTPTGRTFHVKPAGGTSSGDGSADRPWRTLEEVATSGKLRLLRAGDSLLLYSGNHGSPSISGDKAGTVSILAAPGQTPQLARLALTQGKNWRIKGLTISPSFGSKPYPGTIVTLGQGGPVSAIALEDCFVYAKLESSKWKIAEWLAVNNGILVGRAGEGVTLRNNHVHNTRFAIILRATKSLCEGNLVTNFSGDGIQILRDDVTAQWNVIKNAYANAAAGDANHDDGIQCFVPTRKGGALKRVKIRGNLIVSREDDAQPLPGDLQGIGFFDGPLIGFEVSENVVLTTHWHGISLVDAQTCRIRRNVVFSRWKTPVSRPWIMLGGKRGVARGNLVQDNYAHSFKLKADPLVVSKNNRTVDATIFRRRAAELSARIEKSFGARHPVSQKARIRPWGKLK